MGITGVIIGVIGCRFWGSGFGFRVPGFVFRVWGLGLKV